MWAGENERVCYETRRHGVVLLRAFARSFALVGVAIGLVVVGWPVSVAAAPITGVAAALALLAVWLLIGERWPLPTPKRHLERRVLTDRAGETYTYTVPLRRGALYSLAVGFLSSFLGIGGGVIHVPLLVRALGFPTHIATATSHFVLAIMAGTGSLTHIALGSFAHHHGLRRTLALSVGVVAGAQLGARISLRLRGSVIQLLLAAALLALAARLLYTV